MLPFLHVTIDVLDSDSTNRPDPKLTGPNVEPESDREGESVTGGFSTFFSGIATVVEQRVGLGRGAVYS